MKPNLFIVGAPKCGTTAWVEYLRSHPSVFFPGLKEPHHFCSDFQDFTEYRNLRDYERLFANSGSALIRGDASVMHLFSEVAAQKIASYNVNSKIIILVRRQEDFLRSLHNQLLFNGNETIESFGNAWRLSLTRVPPPSCREPRFLNYMAQGFFYEQVMRYVEAFGTTKIRVFHFDDWTQDPVPFYEEILQFLGLDHDGRTNFPRVNEGMQHRLQWLGRFTESPPAWAIKLSSIAKDIMRRERPPFVERLRQINTISGYRNKGADQELSQEIRSFYLDDNRLLESLIWRPERR